MGDSYFVVLLLTSGFRRGVKKLIILLLWVPVRLCPALWEKLYRNRIYAVRENGGPRITRATLGSG